MGREPIELMSQRGMEHMREAGRFAATLLSHLEAMLEPGVTTGALNDEAERYTQEFGAFSAPLGYPGGPGSFPKSICTSVNEVVCHGIPSEDQVLKDGDIINIDVTPNVNGYHGDTSKTFYIGTPSDEAKALVEVTRECLALGIACVQPGARIREIGAAIQEHAESRGYSVVRDFVGHGTGRIFHTAPQVAHYDNGDKTRIREGMVFTIEPMINCGTWKIRVLDDGWTAVTKDGRLTAQFEHTLGVTKNGCEIFTLKEGETYPLPSREES
jgi:methionyl aminopeptidase